MTRILDSNQALYGQYSDRLYSGKCRLMPHRARVFGTDNQDILPLCLRMKSCKHLLCFFRIIKSEFDCFSGFRTWTEISTFYVASCIRPILLKCSISTRALLNIRCTSEEQCSRPPGFILVLRMRNQYTINGSCRDRTYTASVMSRFLCQLR